MIGDGVLPHAERYDVRCHPCHLRPPRNEPDWDRFESISNNETFTFPEKINALKMIDFAPYWVIQIFGYTVCFVRLIVGLSSDSSSKYSR